MDDRDSLGSLHGLPDDLINYVLRHLTTKAITCLSCTSKAWNVLCNQEPVWKKRWLSHHPHEASFKVSANFHLQKLAKKEIRSRHIAYMTFPDSPLQGSWKALALEQEGAPKAAVQQALLSNWRLVPWSSPFLER